MKRTNKEKIVFFNCVMIILSCIVLLTYTMHEIIPQLVPSVLFKGYTFLVITSLLGIFILITFLKWQIIIEYDLSGEVLSIKNYKWYLMKKKIIIPIFEMPKKQIVSYQIESILLYHYLIIILKKDSEKTVKVRINITGFSQRQLYKLHADFDQFLIR